jgi:hypothetical protein
MPASYEFKLSISQALTDQLREHLHRLNPAALTPGNLAALESRQGIYQLYLGDELVYVGSAATTLPKRLSAHLRKLGGRDNISLKDVGFTCLYVDEDLTVLAPEDRLIRVFRSEGRSPWNFNGFGNKDPGRNRDSSHVSDDHFDRMYPIRMAWPCTSVEAGPTAVMALLTELKAALPFLLRFERTARSKRDFTEARVVVPASGMTARDLLTLVAAAIPAYQVTALPGYVIIYREQTDYPNGEVIGRDLTPRLSDSMS